MNDFTDLKFGLEYLKFMNKVGKKKRRRKKKK